MQVYRKNERILCRLSKSEISRLCSIAHAAMETTKTSNFTCQSKSFTSTFFTCQVSACELQPFSCHDSVNDLYSQTAKTVFSHQRCDYILFLSVTYCSYWVVGLSKDEHLRKGLNVLEFPKLSSRVKEPTAPGNLS